MARLRLEQEKDPSPTELGKYRGEWVAVHGGRVIAHGLDPEQVHSEAQRLSSSSQPMIYRIPKGELLFQR